jgi:hypothetical protein
MRTTIDLDDTLLDRLRDAAHREGISFRAMLHRVLLAGLESQKPVASIMYDTPVRSLGRVREGVDLVKALELAAALEDEDVARKLRDHR